MVHDLVKHHHGVGPERTVHAGGDKEEEAGESFHTNQLEHEMFYDAKSTRQRTGQCLRAVSWSNSGCYRGETENPED
jgi:hypothetical protein